MDLRAFPKLPVETLLGLARSSGSSTRYINLSGHGTLKSSTLQELVSSLYIAPSQLGGLPFTQLTEVNLRGCCNVSTRTLHHLLMCSPALVSLGLRGLTAVASSTCDIIGVYCTRLESLDISRCINLDGSGVRSMCEAVFTRREPLRLRELRAAGLKYVTSDLMLIMGHVAPHLEVLDLSGARSLTNSGLRAFIECMEDDDVEKVVLTSRQAGLDPTDPTRHWRRVTRLRHLAVSCCTSLTDVAFKHLAHAVPQLVYLEAAGIGAGIHDDGLVHLLRTTPLLKKLDLEDASSITDGVISALTPDSEANDAQRSPRTGQFLEHLTLSYATQVSDEALSRLIQACSCLRILEADNTRMSGTVLQEFVRTTRRRGIHDAMIAAGDNRNVGESTVTGLQSQTRPRQGFREWDARRLGFLDYRDQEGLENIGSDECDPSRVVVKTFYSWQMVDTVRATRRKHAKSRRVPSWEEDMRIDRMEGSSRMRWWSPGGRRIVSALTTPVGDPREAGDACIIM
jgi:F-box/leucine-rich repeat protein 2/20